MVNAEPIAQLTTWARPPSVSGELCVELNRCAKENKR